MSPFARRLRRVTTVVAATAACTAASTAASTAAAQGTARPTVQPDGQFKTGAIYAGPRLWIGNLNGALAIGGQAEKGLTEPGRYGPGIISGGVGIDWYSWSFNYGPTIGEYKYSVIPLQAFSNYHFVIESNKKLDPYVGLALVYSLVHASWSGTLSSNSYNAAASSATLAGQGGLRYFVSDKFAVQGQIGFGYGTLGLGATWRF